MLQVVLTGSGIRINKSRLVRFIGQADFNILLSETTHSKTLIMGGKQRTRTIEMYYTSGQHIYFARFLLRKIASHIKNRKINTGDKWTFINKLSSGEQISITPGITLDANQILISSAIDKIFTEKNSTGQAGCVLVLGTGLGKTFIGCSKIADLKLKTLIIVPSEVVLNEWASALSIAYPDISIGRYTGKQKQDGDVVLMIANSATSDTFKFRDILYSYAEYFAKFGFVIYDEIHNYTSDKRQTLLRRTGIRYSLGLTATPDENPWGADIVFENHCGPLLIARDIPNYNPQQIIWTGSIFPVKYYGPPEHTRVIRNTGNGWTSYCEMTKQFCADPYRTQLIVDLIQSMYKCGRNVFVFFSLREYASILSTHIVERLGCTIESSDDVSILMGNASTDDYEKSQTSKIVLTTYSFGWQGLSIPRMDTIIFATPRISKMKQIIGRILRSSGDPSIPRLVYDIVDANTKMGLSEFRERSHILMSSDLYKFEMCPTQKYTVKESRLVAI